MPEEDFQTRVLEWLQSIDNSIRGDGEQPGILMRLDRIERSEVLAIEDRQAKSDAAKSRSAWMRALVPVLIASLITNLAAIAKLISLASDVTKK